MAISVITYVDEEGRRTRYRWQVEILTMVDPKAPLVLWTDEPPDPTTAMSFIQVVIYCGPAAPYPEAPTADEWFLGLVRGGTLWSR